MSKVYLHVGLHKTATTFLQKNIFNSFDQKKILYNPEKLSFLQNKYFKLPEYRDKTFIEFRKELELLLETDIDIFISYEIMSGNLFSCYDNYKEHAEILKELFEGCELQLIVVLRYQVDWLISTYRESVHEHHYQSIEEFLNIKDGEFLESKDNNKYANCNALSLDFYGIISNYQNLFGNKNIHVLYFENFKKNNQNFIHSFENILRTKINIVKFKSEITNRGYSANGIHLVLNIIKILRKLHFDFLVPSPIYFFGQNSIYIKDNKNEYKKSLKSFLTRSNIVKLPFIIINKISYKLFGRGKFFRHLIKKIVDKMHYDNKPMVSDQLINHLDNYFTKKNKKLLMIIEDKKIPTIYIEGKNSRKGK